jgi:hypothetical protein
MVNFGKFINNAMKRLLSPIPLPFLFLLFLSSCSCKDIYYNLTEEELKLLVYKEGDVVMFKNNHNVIDTLVCRASGTFGYASEKSEGYCRYEINKQIASAGIIGNSFSLGINLRKLSKENISHNINFFIEDQGFKEVFDKSIAEHLNIITLEINNEIYLNTYVFEGHPNTEISKIYFQKEYGFLRFEMTNDEFWEIYK